DSGASVLILVIQLQQDRYLDGARNRKHPIGILQNRSVVCKIDNRYAHNAIRSFDNFGNTIAELLPQQVVACAAQRFGLLLTESANSNCYWDGECGESQRLPL